jgi:hypothetical protein
LIVYPPVLFLCVVERVVPSFGVKVSWAMYDLPPRHNPRKLKPFGQVHALRPKGRLLRKRELYVQPQSKACRIGGELLWVRLLEMYKIPVNIPFGLQMKRLQFHLFLGLFSKRNNLY